MLEPPELKKGHGFFHHLEAKFDLHVSTNVASLDPSWQSSGPPAKC